MDSTTINSAELPKAKHKGLLFLYFLAIFCSTFYLFFKTSPIYPVFNNMDECVVLFIVLYASVKKWGHYKNKKLILLLIILFIAGYMGNVKLHTQMLTALLGASNTMKPILLFWAFSQFDFEWADLKYLLRIFGYFLPIIFIAYVLDFFFPEFREIFGRAIVVDSDRGGLRALCGIFYRPTYATIWGLIYYVYYRFYTQGKPKKANYIFAVLIQVFSFKVKDLLGFIAGIGALFFKKISKSRMIIWGIIMVLAFALYAVLMPEHFNKYIGTASEDTNIARVALSYTSVKIARDHAPIGVGWGMYGSPISRLIQSPVYTMYHINHVYGLNFAGDGGKFMCDTFWPMLLGELGILGTGVYIYILWLCFSPFIKRFIKDTSDRGVLMPSFLFIVLFVETIGKQTLVGPPHSLIVWGIAGIFYSLMNKPYPYKVY